METLHLKYTYFETRVPSSILARSYGQLSHLFLCESA